MAATIAAESRMLINGALTDAASAKKFDNVNPFTEQTLGQVADAGADDMASAIGAARAAFDAGRWAADLELRKTCLRQLQDALVADSEALRAELVAEVGTPIRLTFGPQLDLPLSETIPWLIDHIDQFPWERELPTSMAMGGHSWRKVYQEPVGVVAAIVPWNFPFEVSLVKVAQALITGNTVILKPAPDTPWNATRLGRLAAEHTDIPAGVLNVVTTASNDVSSLLVTDPRVDLISFTGSTAVGRYIAATAGPSMKRLFLELGGKSAHVVLDDADVAAAAARAATMICLHGGQGCAMQSRLLVPRSHYDQAVEAADAAMAAVRYGDPTDPDVLQGPQANARQRDRILDYVAKGVSEGARLVRGGRRPAHLPTGYFVEPTLFVDVDNSMTIAREEIFGPVQVIIPFDNDDDAVRIANDSDYGLSGGVTSGDEQRALAVAKRIRSGTVAVNGGVFYGADAPFGGYKSSGVGRQNGLEGFAQYTETKTIAGTIS
jgi:aldehyde dehydrogenase (NAD+)